MQDIKIKAISIKKAVFPNESGKVDLDSAATDTVRAAIDAHERLVLVPDVSGDRVVKCGDICIPADIDQFMVVKSSSGVLMYTSRRSRYKVVKVESDERCPYIVTVAPARFTETYDENLPGLMRELKERYDELFSEEEPDEFGCFEDFELINQDIPSTAP